jgi:hypothetical protein
VFTKPQKVPVKYSASAASRRFPEAHELLKKSRVNLMTLSSIAQVLTEENHKSLLASICDKIQREAEAIACNTDHRFPCGIA